jgi:phosphotransferase system enzyme I (PtsI)
LELQRHLKKVRQLKAVTRDQQLVTLQANVDLPSDLDLLRGSGADGIGLFRTEYLFMNRQSPPDEDEQYEAYASVISALQGRPVTIRTLDLGADKQVDGGRGGSPVAVNPALGLRAIRLCLSDLKLFLPQLRALLRASRLGPLRILIPMLSNTRELFHVRGLIKTTIRDLKREGQAVGDQIKLGGMIEVPAAALSTRTFAKHLDFLSIGTNDLIQYTLAVDRVDDQVSYLYEPSHPAVMRLLRMIIDEAAEIGTPVSMCGEMAGDPNYTRLLLSMGLRDFSMPAAALAEVKHVIRRTDIGSLKPLARRLRSATNPVRIATLMREMNHGI